MNKSSLSNFSFDEIQQIIKQIQTKAQDLNLSKITMKTNYTFGVRKESNNIVQNFFLSFNGELFQEQKSEWEKFDEYINSFNLESNSIEGELKNLVELRPNYKQLKRLESEYLKRFPGMENSSPLDLTSSEPVVVLVVWEYTWVGFDGDKECNPNCEKFMNFIQSEYESNDWKGKVRFIGLNADQFSRSLVKEEIEKGRWPIFEHYDLGPGIHSNSFFKNWGINNYPSVLILDKERNVVFKGGHDQPINFLSDMIKNTLEGLELKNSEIEDDLEGSPAEDYLDQRKALQDFINQNNDLVANLESYELKFFIINESKNFPLKINPTYRGKFVFFAKAKTQFKEDLIKFKEQCLNQLGDYNPWIEFSVLNDDGSLERI